jgi:threonine/homoserine/homoserine lactone efflux protein
VAGLTFIFGSIVKRLLRKSSSKTWTDKLFPYALVYLPLAVVYAFVVNELPLTGFSTEPVYYAGHSSKLGPQSISGEAIVALIILITSIILNLVVWLCSFYIVIRYYLKRKRQ